MFNAIDQALQKCHASADAAETHGIICGFLSLNQGRPDDAWLHYVLTETDTEMAVAGRRVLLGLKNYVVDQFKDDAYPVNPLLPGDDCSLGARSAALGRWCAGYLLGLSLAGLTDMSALSAEANEFIEDLTRFTQIDEDSAASEEDDADAELQERAYAELFEYVRVGMLTLRQEQDFPQPSPPRQLH